MLTSAFARTARRVAALLALTGAALCCPLPALAHDDGAYWHDTGATAKNPQWMLTISGAKKLTELSLPGTHDSGTYPGIGGPLAQTQTMNIGEQLESGIRYLDIRVKYVDPATLIGCAGISTRCQVMVFHGGVQMNLYFERDVLRPTVSFLKNNPSEIVIMRIAKETANCNCNPGEALDELLEREAILDGVPSGQKYADYLLPLSCPDPDALTLGPVRPINAKPDPASCNARGKLLIVDQFMSGAMNANHHYRREHTEAGDGYIRYAEPVTHDLTTNWDLYDLLWVPTKAFLGARVNEVFSTLQRTGLAGSVGGFPYFFASGHVSPETGAARLSTGLVDGITANASTYPDFPRTGCALGLCTISFEGMNTLVADYLMRPNFHLANSRVGIVTADFPGWRLITAVAGVNAGVTFSRPSFAYALVTSDGKAYVPGTWTNRQVVVKPQCDVVCVGNRLAVSEDLPNGFNYVMSGGGHSVSFMTSPVRVDPKPPTITAAATTQPGRAGWYTGNVTVRFSCADTGGSGVAQCPGELVLSREGIVSTGLMYALDVAGNKSDGASLTVKIDKTPPAVVYRGNLGAYSPGQTVDIKCEAMDKDSGVASTSCADIRGLASSFGPGSHRYSATATDVAGNTGLGTTTFTVVTLPGDVNFDGAINCQDQAVVKASFGRRTGQAGFDARADVNGDGVVDIRDLSFVAQKLAAGTSCP